jgi:hypothetical protein
VNHKFGFGGMYPLEYHKGIKVKFWKYINDILIGN